jgi:hypothetical protein
MSGVFDFINCSRYRAACENGSTFAKTMRLTNDDGTKTDLTGYSASMQVRPAVTSADVLFDLTSKNNGGLTVTCEKDVDGNVTKSEIAIVIPAADTEDVAAGKYYYDLIIKKDKFVERLLEGKFEVTAAITQE